VKSPIRRSFHPVPVLALFLLAAACRNEKVVSYRVPKEKDGELPVATATNAPAAEPAAANPGAMPATAPGAGMAGMAGMPVVTAAGPGLTWSAPASWQPKALGAMRKGSYTIAGEGGTTADLSITAFPGAVGGEFANVNRWRGQLSLPPIDEAALPSAVTRLTQGSLTLTVVDLASTGPGAQRILGAMVPFGGAMWFFKLIGPDALVAQTKPAFLDFLKTVQAAPATP